MANSCIGLREELLACVAESACFTSGTPFEECMQIRDEDGGCLSKRLLYMQCKRGQLDMRNRFKGNVPGQPSRAPAAPVDHSKNAPLASDTPSGGR
jgi:cytochrome c oxidase assembly factor 5